MSKGKYKNGKKEKKILILSILTVFIILGSFVFHISARITEEMSNSAITNLSESLNLIEGTVEVLFEREAEYQQLIAEGLAMAENPEEFILSYGRKGTVIKMSLIFSGETSGISSTGETFTADGLDFSGYAIGNLPVSGSYVNDMGAWAYTMKCPVYRDGKETATLYIEHIYESLEATLPDKLYNSSATLYIMDSQSERFLLKPKGKGERAAGHLNLDDFYHANKIWETAIQKEVADNIKQGQNVMFYHEIKGQDALIYMWAVNGGMLYLIGYVPIESIQREGKAVNQNILSVVIVMLAAFCLCCSVYFIYERQQEKIRKEQESERELHNRQLAEALQAAQAANNSKTTFLSNMSHDIRTPMNAILGFTALLEKDAGNEGKVREYTKKITASGRHLLSLINDVLDVSKIESGKVVLTIGEFNLSSLITSVDAIIRPAAKDKRQTFEVSVTGIKQERLIGDETRINQILIKLLSNAVKYTQEEGHIWFRIIGLNQRSGQYAHIRIEVEDNGYGMSEDYLKVIFDAFTRAENSTTNKVQGTGLGMAITKNLVELMGGSIEVKSEEGKGSLFTVELELRIAEQDTDADFWKKHKLTRLLVVDDEEETCRNIQYLMKDTEVSVDMLNSGENAADIIYEALAEGNPYHMVLLDWKMPGIDGMETARRIRDRVPENLPILLLTAHDWDSIEEEALRAGINGFLAKPFFVSALKEKITEMQEEDNAFARKGENDAEPVSLEGRNFLVAEDNEINAEILQEILSMEGASCEIAVNGALAVARFAEAAPGEFDAILMDVQMPVMNGYEATRQIRALEREDAGTVPIIAMTANAFAEDVRDALNAGMNAHISKPVDLELLKKTINLYIRKEG